MTTVVRGFSDESLPDPPSYYSGHKRPLVLSWAACARALSSLDGDWEAARTTVELSDIDGSLRALELARSQVGTAATLRWVSSAGRAARVTARTLFAGQVLDVQQTGDYRVILSLRDAAAAMLTSPDGRDRQFPSRTISRTDFPAAAASVLGATVPVFFGYVADYRGTEATDARGLIEPIYVGTRVLMDGLTWHEWVVAGHACDRITALVTGTEAGSDRAVLVPGDADFGTVWLAPKEAGWTTACGAELARTYNGRDYCCVYGRGTLPDACAAGTTRLGVNVKGWTRDGIGGDYISDLFEQWLVFLVNYVCGEIIPPAAGTSYATLREWQSGALLPMPTVNGVAMVDATSFYTLKAEAALRVTGGYEGYVALDRAQSLRQILADFARSAGAYLGVNQSGQYVVVAVPVSFGTPLAVSTATDVLRESFSPTIPSARERVHTVKVRAFRVPQGAEYDWAGSEVVGATTQPQRDLDLPFLTNWDGVTVSPAARAVAVRWLALTAARQITFRTTPCVGFQLDLGALFTLDHDAGWPDRVWMVHRWSVDPRTYAVEIAAVDVGGIVAVVDAEEAASTGGVPQGDEGAPVMWADPWEAWRPGLAAPPAEVLS